jgi:hypothetical protein
MKTIQFLIFALFLISYSCTNPNQSGNNRPEETASQPAEIIMVDQILDNPDDFIDRKVRVEGMVTHVCRHSGKRLHLTSKSTSRMIRIEAAEGINQFKKELEGSDIVVEGIFHRQIIDEDYLAKWEKEGLEGEGVHIDHDPAETEEKEERIQMMRKQLQKSGGEELVSLWVDGNHFEIKQ